MEALTLAFAELPPGLNGHAGLLRMHWTQRQALNRRWHLLVYEALSQQSWQGVFSPQQPCEIQALRRDFRLMDWDNFGASLKPVLDGLVKCGVLTNDNPLVVQKLTLYQQRPLKGQRPALLLRLTPQPSGLVTF